MRKLRLGIDVGGTFTDVVAIDAATRELIARVKVPTTHRAAQGVAAGIVEGIATLLERTSVRAQDVAFIAHSTTQATNALLEGDVARVGVVGLLGAGGWLARLQMRFAPLQLAAGLRFEPEFAFARASDERSIAAAVAALVECGVESVAASEAFGVDRPHAERVAVDRARERGVYATSGHDVTSMYGLRARTRTTALNAAILPKMVQTARMTASAVERALIEAPLMIMRSDGGVMDVREIERRPILTLCSGPAAGVAGALLYENVTDGIFIEVGGTSSDCSAIRAGQPQMRSAQIGGHRTMLRTVDSRTLGIAGGSMVRITEHGIVDVGPRSAHIAGCAYACFTDAARFDGARVEMFAPTAHDPADYAAIVLTDGTRVSVTPTCASNLLGYVPQEAFARGDALAAGRAFEVLGAHLGMDAHAVAREMLAIAARKVQACIDALIADYELERDQLVLIGGGGGAAAIVPAVSDAAKILHRIARDAEVISPIGVALALVREVVERTIVDPTPADIVRIRQEASDKVIAAGASPDRIEVSVEIDAQRNRVRATAQGATALVQTASGERADDDARRDAAARSLRCAAGDLERIDLTPLLVAYTFGRDTRIVDERGIVRLALRDAALVRTTAAALDATLRGAMERATAFGDVGRAIPEVHVIHGGRIADFSGLATVGQAAALAAEEVQGRSDDDPVAIFTIARQA